MVIKRESRRAQGVEVYQWLESVGVHTAWECTERECRSAWCTNGSRRTEQSVRMYKGSVGLHRARGCTKGVQVRIERRSVQREWRTAQSVGVYKESVRPEQSVGVYKGSVGVHRAGKCTNGSHKAHYSEQCNTKPGEKITRKNACNSLSLFSFLPLVGGQKATK